ncbi:MAG: lysine--tRNA ligase [Anaerolineaceae bacterium]|nr:lysine--tRNA ligase [Anaerolineaceae bacterium]
MELSDLEKFRFDKIQRMRAEGTEPYPTRTEVDSTIAAAIAAFEDHEKAGNSENLVFVLGGRLRAIRLMGKLAFAHIEDGSGRIQLFFRVNELGETEMLRLKEHFDLGDYIQAGGALIRTRTGEISLLVSHFKMLAKAIRPLPAAKDEIVDGEVVRHATLSDAETRYRQRYADLAVNEDVREIFRKRAAVVRALREFLDARDFLEVETPILQPIYGGAAARPFVTHHNQLKQDLYLRISFELYLKRLTVGGFDRVYEIGRDFRNEGVSFKHNPEFTQLELYWAYADYLKVMELTEAMIAHVCDSVFGTRKVVYDGVEINFNPPWKRVNLRQSLIENAGIDIDLYPSAESLEEVMNSKGLKVKPGEARGKLIEQLLEEFVEPTLIQPTFMYDYPRDISPLAKNKPGEPATVERFEGFVLGMELCNAFTELNDPLEQEKRFLEMGRDYKVEDEQRHPMDEDYLNAMAYGMPPQGGFGMGVDRLVMILTGKKNIREVLLFPHLRERDE